MPSHAQWGMTALGRLLSSSGLLAIPSEAGHVRSQNTQWLLTFHTDKVVTRLEYQAYSKLAIRSMVEIVRNVTTTSVSPLISCAVHHRLGTVPVGEASIVIAVSSPHRKAAFVACEQILEEVKQKTQIWKREYYAGEDEESAEWKANYS